MEEGVELIGRRETGIGALGKLQEIAGGEKKAKMAGEGLDVISDGEIDAAHALARDIGQTSVPDEAPPQPHLLHRAQHFLSACFRQDSSAHTGGLRDSFRSRQSPLPGCVVKWNVIVEKDRHPAPDRKNIN